jgi:hypothetical protein
METSTKLVIYSILAMVILALGITAWIYPIKKDYKFLVEASCTPSSPNCFYRDCSDPLSDCPPNNFDNYQVYTIKASEFQECKDGTCSSECVNGTISCKLIKCGGPNEMSCQDDPEANAQ